MKTNTKTKKKFKLFDKSTGNIPSGNITYIIAFVIPVVIFIALYYVREMFPFGSNCYLRSDMYHQYAPFFSELWHKIRTGENLTYSWDIGMGTNFTSLYAYYLASPANWLIALFPQKYMIEIMNGLIILKLAGSSLSLTYYISKHFNTKSVSIALFGFFYALSGYVAAYSWNIMWLDCIILVPLIMLGLERLVNENKCFLYCITLGLCIYTNYYIAIMVCLSVVLYFIVLIISFKGTKSFVIYLKKFLNFGIFSLLAGGLAACLLLPEFYTFSLSASSDISFPKKLTLYFSILNMLTRHLIDVPVHLGLEHYPNIYCGVAVFLLLPLYMMDKKVDLKEKIGKSAILLVFLTAFNLNIPNFIWHGFHFPNSLPCRQSFIYVFFLLTMCYEAFSHIKEITTKKLGAAFWIAFGLLILIEQTFAIDDTYNFKTVYISALFIIIYALFMLIHIKTNWKIPVMLFCAFSAVIIECTMNMESTGLGTTSRTSYLLDYNAVETVTDTVAKNDNSFYRMDKIFGARSKNDGAWHNYRSISTFSSTSNAGMSSFLGKLGFEHSTNAYGCNGGTLVTQSLFSTKYVISNRILKESKLREFFTGSDGEFIYRNNYTLPIGFMTYGDVNQWVPSTAGGSGIENQNLLVQNLTGVTNVFTLTMENASDSSFTIKPVKNGHLYLVVKNTGCDSVTATINDSSYTYSNLKNNNRIVDIGYVEVNDNVTVSSDTTINASVYTLEEDRFISAFNTLNNNSMEVTSFSTTKITGKIKPTNDATLIFSIPYDGGWSVYIDGKKVPTVELYDALLSVKVTSGEHTITLKYTPVGLVKGILITLLCILILAGIYVFNRLRELKRINTKHWPVIIRELIDPKDVIYKKKKKKEIPTVSYKIYNKDGEVDSEGITDDGITEEHIADDSIPDDVIISDHIPDDTILDDGILDSLNDFDNLDSDDIQDDNSQ